MSDCRIGIDVTSAITQGGGIGRYTRELIRALVELDQSNAYHFFSAKPPEAFLVPDPLPIGSNIQYHPAPLSERWLYRLWYRLRLPLSVEVVTGKLDLFHSPDFVLPPVSKGVPTLLTVHDLSFIHYPETFPNALVDYLNSVVPWSVRRASHILADSQATKQDLINFWQVQPGKITVLYSGVDARFQPVSDDATLTAVKMKYKLGDAPYLLSVGTLQPRKNFQMLIQAFAPIAAQYPHNLYIAGGKGWLYEEMMTEITRQGLYGRVRFIGFVDDKDLPALYSAATLFLFPSLYEGFGLPLLEAMACGVPVISSDASSLPEVVGDAAIQCSPNEVSSWTMAIDMLLNDKKSFATLRKKGFLRARKFSWTESARQLLTIYAKLLA